ncbi:hypothetical protein PCASD_13986 [Puccinia coronata f. sp. avenae]|uniref:Golgi apparatus membrane protein tvp38 n=1 Tax=Puccinia coronata f. sp. avenae TaxID=200324 RepID=A0A2N5UCG0_9BASI|nr:hypothetical protein PCASD_13986 [Puccinia coronata f. sp. avenae]
MDSPPADAYRKEHIHLSSAHLPTHIGPTLTYRSSSSSPTVVGPSVEKLPISKPTHFTPSSSTTGHKLRLHQRFARAVRQEASECKEAASKLLISSDTTTGNKPPKRPSNAILIVVSSLREYSCTAHQGRLVSEAISGPDQECFLVLDYPHYPSDHCLLPAVVWARVNNSCCGDDMGTLDWLCNCLCGTFLGEIMTYYAFKYLIGERSARVEAGSVTYASLAKLMREGGLGMVILVRASAMPGHVCTAMQATIGIGLWVFTVACVVTLPKQFALVYGPALRGGLLETDRETQAHHRISAAVFLLTAFFTILSAYIVWMRLRKIRPIVQQEFDAPTSSPSTNLLPCLILFPKNPRNWPTTPFTKTPPLNVLPRRRTHLSSAIQTSTPSLSLLSLFSPPLP